VKAIDRLKESISGNANSGVEEFKVAEAKGGWFWSYFDGKGFLQSVVDALGGPRGYFKLAWKKVLPDIGSYAVELIYIEPVSSEKYSLDLTFSVGYLDSSAISGFIKIAWRKGPAKLAFGVSNLPALPRAKTVALDIKNIVNGAIARDKINHSHF